MAYWFASRMYIIQASYLTHLAILSHVQMVIQRMIPTPMYLLQQLPTLVIHKLVSLKMLMEIKQEYLLLNMLSLRISICQEQTKMV
jgi:hypothetical protein